MLFKKNSIQCLHCKEVLVSTDDVPEDSCSCGRNRIHGGSKFLSRTGKRGIDYKELSEANIEELNGSDSTEQVKSLKNYQQSQKRGN